MSSVLKIVIAIVVSVVAIYLLWGLVKVGVALVKFGITAAVIVLLGVVVYSILKGKRAA
jgi:hypothetical protein